jgi:hypothetical protein
VNNVLPARLSLVMVLATAFLVAIAWDQLSTAAPGSARALGLTAIVGCLLTWAPIPLPGYDLTRPEFFRAGADILESDAVVLLLPMAQPFENQAQLWQSDAAFRFRMYGGYALNRDASGQTSYGPPSSPVIDLVQAVRTGRAPDPASLARARDQLRADGASAIIVVDGMPTADAYRNLATQLSGQAPDIVAQGVSLWRLRPPTRAAPLGGPSTPAVTSTSEG